MMEEEIFSLFYCTSKISDHIASIISINNTVQKAKDEIVRLIIKCITKR